MSSMIRAEKLTKRFGAFTAVEDVSFEIPRGQVVAFLGANGAGKSTTMRLLMGYLTPTAGRAFIAGFDMTAQRIAGAARIGYLPENGPLYLDMTPRQHLNFFGQARGMDKDKLKERIASVARTCAIEPVLDKAARKLSKGYRQRTGLAHALLHDPDVLIMDEPTSGLDPNQVRHMRGTIRELSRSKTILLSTHILQEVKAMADRVMVIHRGHMVFDGEVDALCQGNETMDEAFHRLTRSP